MAKLTAKQLAQAYGGGVDVNDQLAAAYLARSQMESGSLEDFEQAEREAAQRRAIKAANAPGIGESVVRGAAQGLTFGYADEIAARLRSVGDKRSYREIRDDIRRQDKAAEEANPIAFGVADVLGSLAPAVVTGGAAAGARVGGTVARTALAGAAEGALAGSGYSEADTIEGVLADAAKGAAIGGVTGAIAGKLTDNAIATAESKATQQFAQDITAGADPTFRKRFLGQSDKLAKDADVTAQVARSQEILQRDTGLVKLLKKPHAADAQASADIVDHLKSGLDDLAGEVRPIYKKLDDKAGQVPMGDVVDWLDGALDQVRGQHGKEALADVLTEVRGNFVKVELAKAAKAGLITEAEGDVAEQIAKLTVPHQDVRQWVTGLLDEKLHKMGSLSETERFTLANEAHRVADNFLKNHLKALEIQAPSLAPDIARLRELNQQIAVYAGAKQLFQHKAAKGLMRQTAWQEAASSRMNQIAGVVGAMTSGSPIGALQAIGVSEGIKRGIQGARKLDRIATAALARVVRAAREGDNTAKLVQKAIEVGVPATAISAALATYRGAE